MCSHLFTVNWCLASPQVSPNLSENVSEDVTSTFKGRSAQNQRVVFMVKTFFYPLRTWHGLGGNI